MISLIQRCGTSNQKFKSLRSGRIRTKFHFLKNLPITWKFIWNVALKVEKQQIRNFDTTVLRFASSNTLLWDFLWIQWIHRSPYTNCYHFHVFSVVMDSKICWGGSTGVTFGMRYFSTQHLAQMKSSIGINFVFQLFLVSWVELFSDWEIFFWEDH